MSEKNILIQLPKDVLIAIERNARHEIEEICKEHEGKPHEVIRRDLNNKLYREKCDHQSALYFKDQRIKELIKIIQRKAGLK